jgi:hypothetical protein
MLKVEHLATSPNQGRNKITEQLFTCQAPRATNEVWYHGYLTERTRIAGKGAHYNLAHLVNKFISQGV